MRAELDAFYARAYGLTRDELRYILDPADVKGPDYSSETFRVLKEKEIRTHGEYRTRRLVLEAWDRMEQDGTFVALGMADATSAAVQPIQLPPLAQFQDAVWAWPQGINERDRVRAQLRAMVGRATWLAICAPAESPASTILFGSMPSSSGWATRWSSAAFTCLTGRG